jgi:1,2-phenylacetyl-CoA epoxidase catalytic subunit
MKLKSFCITKEMVSKLKRLLTEWEKIFASYTSDKGLITRTKRKLKKLNSPKFNDPVKNWANELNRAFSVDEVQMAKKHLKKCSTSLAMKEMQIKTTLRFHFTPVRMATIKNTNNNTYWQGCWEKELSYTPGGNVN